ncbi:MAG: acyltransferase [Clostridia bacterium]|nr:acyltransferase [Clostridia bacterium]
MPDRKERLLGVDLMRMVAMIMIAYVHVLENGGVLDLLSSGSIAKASGWTLEISGYCSANCFALISGYIGVRSKHKYSSLIVLYLQTLFYSVLITLLYALFSGNSMPGEMWLDSLFPFFRNTYWYFTGYAIVFLLAPLFHAFINRMNKKQAAVFMAALFTVFSIFPLVTGVQIPFVRRGYSAVWLAVMYISGACISRHELYRVDHKWVYALIYIASVLLNALAVHFFSVFGFSTVIVISQISPFVYISGVALLLFFSSLSRIPNVLAKLIRFFSPLCFSAYLIHVHPVIWQHLFSGAFEFLAAQPVPVMMAGVVLSGAAIFLVCALLDYPRHLLFQKTGIKPLISDLEMRIREKIKRTPQTKCALLRRRFIFRPEAGTPARILETAFYSRNPRRVHGGGIRAGSDCS